MIFIAFLHWSSLAQPKFALLTADGPQSLMTVVASTITVIATIFWVMCSFLSVH